MQACLTKFFQPLDPSKTTQYHSYLFEKEESDQILREQERIARITAEQTRLRKIKSAHEQARRLALHLKRQQELIVRTELARRKFEGQLVIPGLYLGGRLASQNLEWLLSMKQHVSLTHILNVTPSIPNYYSHSSLDHSHPLDTDPDLFELVQELDAFETLDPVMDSAIEPVIDSTLDPVRDSTLHSAIDPVMDSTMDSAMDSTMDSAIEPVIDSTNFPSFIYERIPIDDDPEVNLTPHFHHAVNFINSALSIGESVLVHCREGRSRSVTMVISFLLLEKKWSLHTAIQHINSIIPDHNINDGFKGQLVQLETYIHGTTSLHSWGIYLHDPSHYPNHSEPPTSCSNPTPTPRRSNRLRSLHSSTTQINDPPNPIPPSESITSHIHHSPNPNTTSPTRIDTLYNFHPDHITTNSTPHPSTIVHGSNHLEPQVYSIQVPNSTHSIIHHHTLDNVSLTNNPSKSKNSISPSSSKPSFTKKINPKIPLEKPNTSILKYFTFKK